MRSVCRLLPLKGVGQGKASAVVEIGRLVSADKINNASPEPWWRIEIAGSTFLERLFPLPSVNSRHLACMRRAHNVTEIAGRFAGLRPRQPVDL